MAISQHKSKQSPSGAKYRDFRKKKQFELGSSPTLTKLAETKNKKAREMGGNRKTRLLSANTANVLDPKTGKSTKAKILNVVGNPANRYFVRRNIITKGTIIKTEKGDARVTSRPGQEGSVNAVLVKE
ncbi:30S ribosomal protein S8e [Candidatus Woesearchaeota archaeon]|nr:30S ribosomal protein S8e [Candidatus Woesearchaeota archaeon]